MKVAIIRFKQRNLVLKINIFGKHIKVLAGKQNQFYYALVKKIGIKKKV